MIEFYDLLAGNKAGTEVLPSAITCKAMATETTSITRGFEKGDNVIASSLSGENFFLASGRWLLWKLH